jgi:hypothetical protein
VSTRTLPHGPAASEHAGNAFDIGVLAADRHAVGNRAWHKPGILAAEEHFHERRAGLGHDRHPVAAPEAGRDQLMGGAHGALAQIAIGHCVFQQAAAVVEVHAGSAAGRIVEGLPQCPERTILLLKTDIGSRRGCRDGCPIRTYNDPRRRFDPHDDPSATRCDRAVMDQRGLPKTPTRFGPKSA